MSDSGATDAAADASDGGGACVTTIAELGGGDGGTVTPTLLFSFDSTSVDPNWKVWSSNNSSASLSETLTDGYPCAGALAMSSTYTYTDAAAYNYETGFYYTLGNQDAGVTYGASDAGTGVARDWTGYSTLMSG